jgi:hypothetical protein
MLPGIVITGSLRCGGEFTVYMRCIQVRQVVNAGETKKCDPRPELPLKMKE